MLDHFHRAPEAIGEMAGLLADGRLKPLETVVEGFEQLPTAINMLFDGANVGKLVVKVARLLAGAGARPLAPGATQASTRAGARPRRILKRVYLPMVPGRVASTSMTVPARSRRCRRRNRTCLRARSPTGAATGSRARGSARRTFMPGGPRTPSRLTRVPPRVGAHAQAHHGERAEQLRGERGDTTGR